LTQDKETLRSADYLVLSGISPDKPFESSEAICDNGDRRDLMACAIELDTTQEKQCR